MGSCFVLIFWDRFRSFIFMSPTKFSQTSFSRRSFLRICNMSKWSCLYSSLQVILELLQISVCYWSLWPEASIAIVSFSNHRPGLEVQHLSSFQFNTFLLNTKSIDQVTLLFVKSDERQMNCLPLTISHAWNHAELKGSCFMSAASGVHTRFPKIKKSKLLLLCSREIANRHFESKECFSTASCKVLCELPTEAKISVYVVEWRLYNYICN